MKSNYVLYCIVLYCIALYSIALYCIVLYCIVLYCIALYCIVLYCIVLYCIVLYCTVLHCIALYCTILYCIVLYCIVMNLPIYISSCWMKKNRIMHENRQEEKSTGNCHQKVIVIVVQHHVRFNVIIKLNEIERESNLFILTLHRVHSLHLVISHPTLWNTSIPTP